MLSSVDFAFDNRDRIQTLMAMTSYWEAKCETKHEETTKEFSDAVKERILRYGRFSFWRPGGTSAD
jgi:predicted alpha-1,6-mannanase (GH76 family)